MITIAHTEQLLRKDVKIVYIRIYNNDVNVPVFLFLVVCTYFPASILRKSTSGRHLP